MVTFNATKANSLQAMIDATMQHPSHPCHPYKGRTSLLGSVNTMATWVGCIRNLEAQMVDDMKNIESQDKGKSGRAVKSGSKY